MAHYSKITVQYRDGSKATKTRVSLGFDHGGNTDSFFTDDYGTAVIEHHATGRAEVYVRGMKAGIIDAPGKITVTIS